MGRAGPVASGGSKDVELSVRPPSRRCGWTAASSVDPSEQGTAHAFDVQIPNVHSRQYYIVVVRGNFLFAIGVGSVGFVSLFVLELEFFQECVQVFRIGFRIPAVLFLAGVVHGSRWFCFPPGAWFLIVGISVRVVVVGIIVGAGIIVRIGIGIEHGCSKDTGFGCRCVVVFVALVIAVFPIVDRSQNLGFAFSSQALNRSVTHYFGGDKFDSSSSSCG
mmetsp:Transcript_25597/g.70428  ORF Transcript_25597/g.70428 Transcript_25597/m.70428 type:complete len:219 (+) Transcript_25597:3279-3935(+)